MVAVPVLVATPILYRPFVQFTHRCSQLVRGAALGVRSIAVGTATADAGNTGDGTCTAYALAAGGPAIVGSYVLTCNAAVTNGGVFKLVDPNGALLADDITITAGPGGTVVYTGNGMTFTITDGANDFVVGDFFTLTITAGTGYAVALDIASTEYDGSELFDSILLDADGVTTGVGASQVCAVAETGEFTISALSFGGSTTAADVKAQMEAKNCYQKTAYNEVNGE